MASRLDTIDLSQSMSREESEKRIVTAQRRLVQLRLFTAGLLEPHQVGPGIVVLFEGMDAAGKGGAIRHLTAGLDPRHVRVVPIAAPNEDELRHHFLWRFQPSLPGLGQMTVYDRSWYGRLLVERVEGLIDNDTAKRSATEIIEFEQAIIDGGVTLVKFWLQISAKEQLRRFKDRETNPLKTWKLTPDDWRNREKRPAYEKAIEYMITNTDQPHARWDLIAAESKPYARATVLETVVSRWVHDLERRNIAVPASRDEDYLD
ncbi:MAG: UDP-galactose-lipid carrier transferase [Acidimicrobiales bacterium]